MARGPWELLFSPVFKSHLCIIIMVHLRVQSSASFHHCSRLLIAGLHCSRPKSIKTKEISGATEAVRPVRTNIIHEKGAWPLKEGVALHGKFQLLHF